jgi:hypothetical protein
MVRFGMLLLVHIFPPCMNLRNIYKFLLNVNNRNMIYPNWSKEGCNRGVACSLLKLGSLEKTVIASLFHSGLHSGSV